MCNVRQMCGRLSKLRGTSRKSQYPSLFCHAVLLQNIFFFSIFTTFFKHPTFCRPAHNAHMANKDIALGIDLGTTYRRATVAAHLFAEPALF